ncbi:MAG: DNA topoisomerase 4 subunit A [Clostridia bacterium]|nr:DNA topoisomerase 4 subunit A [Clostridia bacterium]
MSEENKRIITSTLEDVLHSSMIPYAEYVILDRALPRVEDGLKPVQRRILYNMYEQGFTPDKGFRKSAKVVGDCLAKYHPHGDTSVYDAMVRMAQPFNMRLPLVDGHGNFGSIDGDGAAAMRYTEVRMQPLAMEMLADIDKETVKFQLNFDDSLKEPETLPGRFPNLLVNGAYGIAVGLATNIPTHNLGEVIDGVVQYINNPRISLDEMMKYIKGPDFPTGGYLIVGQELKAAYETGRGKVIMRAKASIEKGSGDKKNIVITEIPYQVNKAALLKKIADLKDEKKDEPLLQGIADIVDESDRSGMRAVIKVKKDYDPQQILNYLYKYTQLQCAFNINMVAIASGKPRQLGLLEIIRYYVDYQRDVILRRTKYDYGKAKERAHVLEGLIVAIRNIDEVIQIIKSAANTTEAKQTLRNRFDLSEVQAQAILDLRLARLTKLEVYKLEEELKQLKELMEKLSAIIDSKKLQMNVVKEEMLAIKKRYRSPRLSTIIGAEEGATTQTPEAVRPVENFVLVYSAAGNFKKVPKKNYDMSDRSVGENTAANDLPELQLAVTSEETAYIFTDLANCYKVDVADIPANKFKEKGVALRDIAPECVSGERAVRIFAFKDGLPEGDLLFFTKQGMVKKTAWSEYGLQKGAFQAAKIKDDDRIISIEEDRAESTMIFVTRGGLCLNAVKDEVPKQGRISGGVKGVNLNDGDEVVYAGQIGEEAEGEIIVVTSFGTFKRVIVSGALEPMARARKGVKVVDLGDGAECIVFAGFVTEPYDLAVRERLGDMYVVNTEEIEIEMRTSRGKNLKKRKKTQPERCYRIENLK